MKKNKSKKLNRSLKPENSFENEKFQNDSYTYHCKKPFHYNGEVISKITIRRATVADAIAADKSGFSGFHEKNAHYFSGLSGHSPQALTRMDLSDWLRFLKGAGDFLGMGGLMAGS